MNRRLFLVALMLIVAAVPAFSQPSRRAAQLEFASDFQTIPVVANTTGIGGVKFQSYVAILNPTSSAMSVQATLYDTAGTARNAMISLAAGELKTYTNFLDAVFQYSGGGAVVFRTTDASKRFIVSTEVRNGQFGTTVPALEFAGSSSRSFSAGITVDASSRTNIGCFNQADVANLVKATVLDKTGTMTLGTVNLNLPANAWNQTAVNTIVSDGIIRFEPSENAVCYAAVVNNTTSDARFISAVEYTP